MSYSQMYPQYQGFSYDSQQQQPWDEVDFTTLPTSGNNYKSIKEPGYYDVNGVPTDSQNAPSPNYSQFLNFDTSDVGSYSVPSEDVPSEPFFRTSPNPLNSPQQSTNYPVKIEPELVRNDSLPCGLPGDCTPPRCGPEPTCLQLTSLPEIEECNPAPFLPTGTTSYADQNTSYSRRFSRTSLSDSGPATKPKVEREKKPRNKRGHKGSSSEDESAHIRAKQAHSVVERRYRDNLNGKIMQLHRALVATESTSRLTGVSTHDFFASREHRGKVRKSDVMTDAMNYVHQSEVEIRHMSDEINRLNERVRALEKLVKCEDCSLLKQMVRLQLQQHQPQQHQPQCP
ncbi:uncharacterized protein Z518_08855 [Rhinocladiella mackenziei CBS 650.93]|uniref:BHLH domain-containing protein n=1 Tax=Rhinocladiella mackenziei CBS 650.93 TaxID=1442369 RepID=A0A0D2FLP8_9EURO|nr:uncharacterized protein Z518_08855 [Rhinocladiella mackenziei CBS 650.93]KIX02912.1 hypothetical protein Z518_08855 [Rhinocladiella mackenziei CBS 650.93]